MTKSNSATLAYDNQTAEHASASVASDWSLLADAKRLGGIASKEFRTSYLVGTIAGMLKKPLSVGAAMLAKKAPLAKDADSDKRKDRRAKIKAGTVVERTADEQRAYSAATMRLSRFCKTHSITPANKARGKAATDSDEAGKEATPKANNAANADKFMRQQCAMMLAYVEKNKPLIPEAMRHAVLELNEAFHAIPENS